MRRRERPAWRGPGASGAPVGGRACRARAASAATATVPSGTTRTRAGAAGRGARAAAVPLAPGVGGAEGAPEQRPEPARALARLGAEPFAQRHALEAQRPEQRELDAPDAHRLAEGARQGRLAPP